MPAHDLDDEEWQDMPVILPASKGTLVDADDWDSRRTHRWPPTASASSRPSAVVHDLDLDNSNSGTGAYRSSYGQSAQGESAAGNATGRFVDYDHKGDAWREKALDEVDEMDYTRLELDDDPDEDEISMRTQYLFNEDKGMTPLSQMQATKTLLTEGQRIAYVGLCRLVAREMVQTLALASKGAKELEPARDSSKQWANKIMGRLYRHMDVDGAEQRMIEQLAEHGVTAEDLVPSLLTTYSIDNPEYDPEAEQAAAIEAEEAAERAKEQAEADRRKREADELEAVQARDRQQQQEQQAREVAEAERLRLEEEEEEKGRVAREVAKIERRESEARIEETPTTPPRSTRTSSLRSPSLKSPTKLSRSSAFGGDDWDDGDIGAALDERSPKLSLAFPAVVEELSTPTKNGQHVSEDEPPTPKASAPPIPGTPPNDVEDEDDPDDPDSFVTPLPSTLPGVSTTLSAADKTITLDIRWTILCDLFLSLIADSVYDARSRVLLGRIAERLGLEWIDVVRFERRLTEALEIQEAVKSKEHEEVLQAREKKDKKARYMMMGLATLGGGLVIGLSAGLLAPVIGAGLGAALTTVGVSGTTTFLAGAGGSAIIASGATITGATIGGKAMARRTRNVKTFDVQPLHNNKRVNFYITIPGFMNGPLDDVRLPFSVIDPLMGDVFSVLWEPEMMGDTGNALKILSSEVLTQAGQQVLALTVMTALMSALQWPMMLTKLSYLIDNPWSNALDRAKQAGAILADILLNRRLGVRPVSLVGFSLGARVIFYALVELAKANAFGVVQEVYLFGATVTASLKTWRQVRGIVSGRFVNAFAMNDWVLGYLFRATSGGLQTVAGLRPIEHVPDLENIDVTHILLGHMSYRTLMPKLLAYVGFKVTADHFDEPEEMEVDAPDREVLTKEEEERRRELKEKKKLLGIFRRKKATNSAPMSRTVSGDYDGQPAERLSTDSRTSSSTGTEKGSSSRGDLGSQMRSSSSLSVSTVDSSEVKDVESITDSRRESIETEHDPRASAPPTQASTNTAPSVPATASPTVPSGFNLDKLREEVSQLPTKSLQSGRAESDVLNIDRGLSTVSSTTRTAAIDPPSTTSPDVAVAIGVPTMAPRTDLTALDQDLDPRELLRRQWASQTLSTAHYDPSSASAAIAAVSDDAGWGAPTPSSTSKSRLSNDDDDDDDERARSGLGLSSPGMYTFSNGAMGQSSQQRGPGTSSTHITFGDADGTLSWADHQDDDNLAKAVEDEPTFAWGGGGGGGSGFRMTNSSNANPW